MFTCVSHDLWLDVEMMAEDDISPGELITPPVDMRMQIHEENWYSTAPDDMAPLLVMDWPRFNKSAFIA